MYARGTGSLEGSKHMGKSHRCGISSTKRAVAIAFTLGGLVMPAMAHDLLPPPFRGDPGSTYQAWDFLTPLPINAPPDGFCPPQNPAGIATMTVSPGVQYFPTYDGAEGVWCLGAGASLSFKMPNPGGAPHEFKTIWVQITMHFHGANPPIAVTAGPMSFIAGFQDLPVPGLGPNWIHRTISLCMVPPCPSFEVVTITNLGTSPADHIDITQVIFDTVCEIECSVPHPPVAANDYDGDGFPDDCDNAPGIRNPNQSDCDGDGLGDVSDTCKICEPGTPSKGEPCGASTNGGCTQAGQPTTPLACNTEYCGDAWAKGGLRDTDWYEITVQDTNGDGTADVILELCTSLPLVMSLVHDQCPPLVFHGSVDAELDRPATLFACVPAPATYRVFIAPGRIATGPIFDGFPCFGLHNQYWLRAWCADPCNVCGIAGTQGCCNASPNGLPGCEDAECCAKVCAIDPFCCDVRWDGACASQARITCRDICCTADLNGDGIVNGADLGELLGYWGAGASPADLNGDCKVDGADLGELLGQWGPC